MFSRVRSSIGSARAKILTLAATAGVLAVTSLAQAGGPPAMPAVTFPVDEESIITSIVAAGAAIMLLVFGVIVGFRMIRKLFSRTTRAM